MQFGELTWKDLAGYQDQVVILPTASLEQHGHHLPVLTDTMIGGEITRLAEAELGEAALFLPVLWLGASDHHRGFPGTLSLNNDLYQKVIENLLDCLIAAGFRRILLLNSHGGNETPGAQALYAVQMRYARQMPDLWLAMASWMVIAAEQIAALGALEQKHVTHACELETSIILRLRPELVKLDAARGANVPFESAFYSPDFSKPSRVVVPRSFDQISQTGAFGRPESSSAEKGEAILAAAVSEVVAFVREFARWQPIQPA
jgi:creatinine amidohydrolase